MKIFSSKFMMIAMATIVFSGLAMAVPVSGTTTATCVPIVLVLTGQSGSGTESCTASFNPTFIGITSVTGTSFFDGLYDGKLAGGVINFSMTLPGTTSPTPVIGTQIQDAAKVLAGFSVTSGLAAYGTAFTVFDAYTGNTSAVVGASFNKTININYTYDTNQAPEPASFAMIGGGLLALGAFARRRRA